MTPNLRQQTEEALSLLQRPGAAIVALDGHAPDEHMAPVLNDLIAAAKRGTAIARVVSVRCAPIEPSMPLLEQDTITTLRFVPSKGRAILDCTHQTLALDQKDLRG